MYPQRKIPPKDRPAMIVNAWLVMEDATKGNVVNAGAGYRDVLRTDR